MILGWVEYKKRGIVCQGKSTTRYGGVLLLHSDIDLTIKSKQRGCEVRRGNADDYGRSLHGT